MSSQYTDSVHGYAAQYNIAAATVVKVGPGLLATITVLVAGAAGTANDVATTGAAAIGNQIATIPATQGAILQLQWPVSAGIVIVPGAAQVVSVAYS